MPTADKLSGAVKAGQFADGCGYDVRVLPRRNIMVTSSSTGWNNYLMDLGKLMGDPDVMKKFGNTAVIWDLHSRKPVRDLTEFLLSLTGDNIDLFVDDAMFVRTAVTDQ